MQKDNQNYLPPTECIFEAFRCDNLMQWFPIEVPFAMLSVAARCRVNCNAGYAD